MNLFVNKCLQCLCFFLGEKKSISLWKNLSKFSTPYLFEIFSEENRS